MGGRRRIAGLAFALVAGAVLGAAAASAQDAPPPFLYINQERILTGSERGRALLAEEEAARDRARAEARAIEVAFETEERELTALRATLDPAEFRRRADDFDARVVEARREQDARANALALEFDQRRRTFYAEVGPILVATMERAGALAVLDEASILLADQALNVTETVIAEIDRAWRPDGEDGEAAAEPEAAREPGPRPEPRPDPAPAGD